MKTDTLEKQKISHLRAELNNLNLKSTGRKAELVTRLIGANFLAGQIESDRRPIVLSYDDRHGWGRLFVESMLEFKGVECRLFTRFEEVPDLANIFVYIHPDHLINRDIDRTMIEGFQEYSNAIFMPSKMELLVYDEKVRQTELYSEYLPPTRIITSLDSALSCISELQFPIISKSNEGAASSNIRFLESPDAAYLEAQSVFSENGIPRHDSRNLGLVQKDYVLWQDFLGGNENDWRVVMLGRRFAWILKRYNRSDLPFASGSGLVEPIIHLNPEIAEILDYSLSFANHFSLNFTGIDLVRDDEKKLRVLETTTGWGKKAFESRVFELSNNGEWRKTAFRGKDQWKIASLAMAEMITEYITSLDGLQD